MATKGKKKITKMGALGREILGTQQAVILKLFFIRSEQNSIRFK